MNRQDAEKIVNEYVGRIFGFALKRCKSLEDAEDLSQDIVLKTFRVLLIKDDIEDIGKFIWTVAHNSLNNYYRDNAKITLGIPLEDVSELLADPSSEPDTDGEQETVLRLQSEIAYLSKMQRRIVIAYYFENRKQTEIAEDLGIPLGTVKWHLFEAKKELKRGMDTVRKTSELKFNPIKFHSFGINGSAGTKNINDFFRSALPQNICYCVRSTAKTINEIADDLGVSPVYVETEIETLEEYGFLKKKGEKFITDFIIDEPTAELLTMHDKMQKRAAELFANDLYDELMQSGILNDERIICNHREPETKHADRNFLLWSLVPYIAAWSGEKLMDKKITFDEVATIRPDGGHNIVRAAVVDDNIKLPEDYVYMKNWCGPMWNGNGKNILWQIDSEWTGRGIEHGFLYSEESKRVLSLFEREEECPLSKDEYAWLTERGYIKTNGDYDGFFTSTWKVIILKDKQIRDELLSIGERIKEKHKTEFDKIKEPYKKALFSTIPAHLRKICEFEMQYIFHADGWFILHCIVTLLNNGKLKQPTEEQRKSLTTMIIPE